MISHDMEDGRFNLRSVAVILRHNAVLIHRAEKDDFWALPGGRVDPFETTAHTLEREMEEEIGCTIHVKRLLWIVENFFSYENTPFHEIAFYHLATLSEPVPRLPQAPKLEQPTFDGWESGDVRLIFEWAPLDSLDRLPLYPSFLRAGLQCLPQATQHISVFSLT